MKVSTDGKREREIEGREREIGGRERDKGRERERGREGERGGRKRERKRGRDPPALHTQLTIMTCCNALFLWKPGHRHGVSYQILGNVNVQYNLPSDFLLFPSLLLHFASLFKLSLSLQRRQESGINTRSPLSSTYGWESPLIKIPEFAFNLAPIIPNCCRFHPWLIPFNQISK